MKNKSYMTMVRCLAISLMVCLLCGCDDDTVKPDNEPARRLCNTVWRGLATYNEETDASVRDVTLSFVSGKVEGTSGYEGKTGETGMVYLSYRHYNDGEMRQCNYCYEDDLLQLAVYAFVDHKWVLTGEYIFTVDKFTSEDLDLSNVDKWSYTPFLCINCVRVK